MEKDDEVKIPAHVVQHRSGFPRQRHAQEPSAFVFNGMPAEEQELKAAAKGRATWLFPDTRRYRKRGLVQQDGDAAQLRRGLEFRSDHDSARAMLLKQYAHEVHREQERISARTLGSLETARPEIAKLAERSVLLWNLSSALHQSPGRESSSGSAPTRRESPQPRRRPRGGRTRRSEEPVSADYMFFLREGRSKLTQPPPTQHQLNEKYMATVLRQTARLNRCKAQFAPAQPLAKPKPGPGPPPSATNPAREAR
uniref:Uncharacterized protein n=1 Tax=Rhizochromulina marina TaxID=1034831 RepID=A0A7S2W2F7_9STRA|mmetsp:Transcript_11764/g.33979  ORF Transcript_11764/g.33979 Transcript_11764/m.33979 type:complete len:254 (+) Transcript_11764:270-1031(+)